MYVSSVWHCLLRLTAVLLLHYCSLLLHYLFVTVRGPGPDVYFDTPKHNYFTSCGHSTGGWVRVLGTGVMQIESIFTIIAITTFNLASAWFIFAVWKE